VIRTSILSSLVLSLVLVGGCKKDPEGTTPPSDDPAESDDGKKPGKKPKASKGDDSTDGESGGDDMDPTKKVCAAETAEYPEPYFEDTVLIRLPKGVSGDNFVEMAPGFARLSSAVESVSCVEGVPGADINYMAMGAFPENKSKTMTVWRDEILAGFQYVGVSFSEEKIDEGKRFYQVVMDVPADGGKEPAKALLQIVAANDFMYAIVMETHPNAWNALKETFYGSAARMSFLKGR
jgi:hypothetical protein